MKGRGVCNYHGSSLILFQQVSGSSSLMAARLLMSNLSLAVSLWYHRSRETCSKTAPQTQPSHNLTNDN